MASKLPLLLMRFYSIEQKELSSNRNIALTRGNIGRSSTVYNSSYHNRVLFVMSQGSGCKMWNMDAEPHLSRIVHRLDQSLSTQ